MCQMSGTPASGAQAESKCILKPFECMRSGLSSRTACRSFATYAGIRAPPESKFRTEPSQTRHAPDGRLPVGWCPSEIQPQGPRSLSGIEGNSGSGACAPVFHGVRPLLYQSDGSDPEFRKRVHRRLTRYSRRAPRLHSTRSRNRSSWSGPPGSNTSDPTC